MKKLANWWLDFADLRDSYDQTIDVGFAVFATMAAIILGLMLLLLFLMLVIASNGIVLAIVLAVGGVAFGFYRLFKSLEDEQ